MGLHARILAITAGLLAAQLGTATAQRTAVYDFSGDALQGQLARPDGERVTTAPGSWPRWDARTDGKRLVELERAVAGSAPDRPERAARHLELGRLLAAQAMDARLHALAAAVATDGVKDPTRRREMEAEEARHQATAQRATQRAIAVLTEVACEPGGSGLDCAARAALRGWASLDDALFELAYLLDAAGRRDDALKVYRRLAADHPASPYAPHALLALADRSFDEAMLAQAEALYARVLQSKATELHPYARYKTGWVQLNLGRDREAFGSFAAVAALTGERNRMLAREAGKDLVRAYAGFGAPAGAAAALDKAAPGRGLELLGRLADLWLDQGRAAEAAAVYSDLLQRAPGDPRICEWHGGIVRGALMAGDRARILPALDAMVAAYGRVRAMKGVAAKAVNGCRDEAASTLGDLAKVWHREAMKTRDPKLTADAERAYRLYLRWFPAAADAGTMRYYRAELAWRQAEAERDAGKAAALWEAAAERYGEALAGKGLDDRQRKDGAYAAVLAWKNALAVDVRAGSPRTEVDGDRFEVTPRPLPAREQKLVDALQRYRKQYADPKDPETVTILYLEGRVYWKHDQLDRALPLFETILADHLDHEVAEYAANLVLDALNRQRKYDAMLRWVDRLLKEQAFLAGKADLADRLVMIRRQADRRTAEQLARDGEYGKCGAAYLALYNANPTDPYAHEVLYNAGVCFEQAGSAGGALSAYQILQQRHGRTPHAQKALARTGLLRARIAHYPEAAAALERYATLYAGEKDAVDALSDAVRYYRAAGDHQHAIAASERFIKQYGRGRHLQHAAEAAFAIAGLYEQAGDPAKAAAALARYLRDFGAKGGVDRQVIAHARIGAYEWRRSCKLPSLVDGACVQLRRPPPRPAKGQPTHCSPPAPQVVAGPRDAALAASARKHFQTAIDLHKRAGAGSLQAIDEVDRAARTRAMAAVAAEAAWHLAQPEYEKFLAEGFPAGLSFDPGNPARAARSKRLVEEWLAQKSRYLGQLRTSVTRESGPADHARLGLAIASMASALRGAPVSADVRTGQFAADKVKAFCELLADKTDPIEAAAVDAFSYCLDHAARASTWNDWTATCARELGHLRPELAPPRELRASADRTAPILDLEPAQQRPVSRSP